MSQRAASSILGTAALLAALGCGARRETGRASPHVGGDVVAVVGEITITREQVAAHAGASGVSARQALTELEDRILLEAAARAGGHRVDEALLRKRVLVQLLMRRVESQHDAATEGAENVVRARHEAVGGMLEAARARVRIDYREPVVAAVFSRTELFEAIR